MSCRGLLKVLDFKFAVCYKNTFSSYSTLFKPQSKIAKPIFAIALNSRSTQKRFDHIKAAVLKEFGKDLEIKEVKKEKKIKEKEIRIKVHCCAVNITDTFITSGSYAVKPKLPFIPGYEFSGEVKEVGTEVKGIAEGDRVIGLNKETFSAMAEECIASSGDIWKIPPEVSYENAAALVDSYATVLIAARRVNLNEGDDVLVTAGAGGLGLAAVDLAANLFKAKVIGASDTEDKASILRDKGAFSAVNYSKKEISDAVMSSTKNTGVKVIFDAVGGDIFDDCLHSIASEGSIVVMGFASRKVPQIQTSELLQQSCALIGVSLSNYRKFQNDVYRDTVQEIIDMYMEEFIEPHIAACFKLEDVNKGFKFIEERKSSGKVIINMN